MRDNKILSSVENNESQRDEGARGGDQRGKGKEETEAVDPTDTECRSSTAG